MQPPAIPAFTMGNNIRPDFIRGTQGIANALAAYQNRNLNAERLAQQQQQFQSQNALAQARLGMEQEKFGLQKADIERQAAQRQAVQNWLATNQNFAGVPEPLIGYARASNDASPINEYIMTQAKLRAQRQLAQSGPEGYGKAGAVFQHPVTGEFKAIQFGERGNIKMHSLGGAEPAKGVKTVDDGTGTRVISGATGRDVRRIDRDIRGKETAEEVGKAAGKFQANYTKYQTKLQSLAEQGNLINDEIERATKLIGPWSTGGVGKAAKNIPLAGPYTDAYALSERIKTIKANIGFDKLQSMREESPTGGALGQVAVQELEMLQAVFGSLETAQRPEDIAYNLQRLQQIIASRRERYQWALDQDTKRFGSPQAMPQSAPQTEAQPSGPRRLKFNPATGRLE